MSTRATLMVLMLMLAVMGATHYGYLSSNVMAIVEALLIGVIWFGELIGKMMEESY